MSDEAIVKGYSNSFEKFIKLIPKDENNILLGLNDNNEPIYRKLSKTKSILVAGASGNAKNNMLHQLILSSLFLNQKIYYYMIDLKGINLTFYNILKGTNKLVRKVATDQKTAFRRIIEVSSIVDDRLKAMKKKNERFSSEPPIILVIEEYAQLFSTKREKEVIEHYIANIGCKSGVTNVYLIIATEYPSSSVINNTVRANVETKIALKCVDSKQSNIILETSGAESLPSIRDIILQISGEFMFKAQATYVSEALLAQIEKHNKN